MDDALDASHRCDACHVAAAQVAILDPETGADFELCGHHFDKHADALYAHYGTLLVDDYRERLVEPAAPAEPEGATA